MQTMSGQPGSASVEEDTPLQTFANDTSADGVLDRVRIKRISVANDLDCLQQAATAYLGDVGVI
ncbi:MAG: hypothetical protein Ct9H300mP8_04290 [Gammaproteobacteria bacterium]|nr:MAG: hypothetical protein Ct9H300mP8_04290 [Gammaproteobacteria bacterium]